MWSMRDIYIYILYSQINVRIPRAARGHPESLRNWLNTDFKIYIPTRTNTYGQTYKWSCCYFWRQEPICSIFYWVQGWVFIKHRRPWLMDLEFLHPLRCLPLTYLSVRYVPSSYLICFLTGMIFWAIHLHKCTAFPHGWSHHSLGGSFKNFITPPWGGGGARGKTVKIQENNKT
jgi:hypothetical protein